MKILIQIIMITIVTGASVHAADNVEFQNMLHKSLVDGSCMKAGRNFANKVLQNEAIPLLQAYEKYPDKRVRLTLEFVYNCLLLESEDRAQRRNIVERLVVMAGDTDHGISGKALRDLAVLHENNFSATAQEQLVEILKTRQASGLLFLACGASGATEAIPQIRVAMDQHTDSSDTSPMTLNYFAHLALARLGSKEDTVKCVSLYNNEHDLIIRSRMLNGMAYMHRPEAVEVLLKELESTEVVPNEIPGDRYADRALQIIALTMDDCPVSFKLGAYTNDQFLTAREWLMNSKTYKWKEKLSRAYTLF